MTDKRAYIKKRRVPRRAFRRSVGLLIRGKYSISESYELGEGGMLVASPVPLKEGQMVVITFQVPGMLHVITRGIVRYFQKAKLDLPDCYGIQFEKIDFNAKRKIRSFVALKSVEEGETSVA